jgi:hypothetical protein
MVVCTGKAHTGGVWSGWRHLACPERASTTGAMSLVHEVLVVRLHWRMFA